MLHFIKEIRFQKALTYRHMVFTVRTLIEIFSTDLVHNVNISKSFQMGIMFHGVKYSLLQSYKVQL